MNICEKINNAAAAFYVAGAADDLAEGLALAEASIDEGRSLSTLERLREAAARATRA